METRNPPVEVDDLIILLLGAPESRGESSGRLEGITRLEKLIFLLEQEEKVPWLTEDVGFVSHNFGPFSEKIYKAVDVLAAADLIRDSGRIARSTEDTWESSNIIGDTDRDLYATRDFELTSLGREYYRALVAELPDGTENLLRDFKRRFASRPLRHLIRYVYERYPAYTDKSIIKDDVMR